MSEITDTLRDAARRLRFHISVNPTVSDQVVLDRVERALAAVDIPLKDDGFCIGIMTARQFEGYEYGCNESMAAFENLLDKPYNRNGVSPGRWQTLKERVWALIDKAAKVKNE